MPNNFLAINNLHVQVGEKEILSGLDLVVNSGEVHVIMGPNGAGKSTLANVLMGHPKYEITAGDISWQGQRINDLRTDARARLGIFLSFQYPEEVPGITLENFLRSAKAAITGEPISPLEFRRQLRETMQLLEMKPEYATRYLNEGFSGGEKKKREILQMLVLQPKLAILDETDSGLDVDAVRIVAAGVQSYQNSDNAMIIITHHSKILEYIRPDFVHLLIDGRIRTSGDVDLVTALERDGFDAFRH